MQHIAEKRSLDNITNHSEEGFYFVIASEGTQREIASDYADTGISVYDYKKEPGSFSFNVFEQWVNQHPEANTFFLVNFHLAIQEIKDAVALNFSRDMLARLKKNLIFFVTQRVDDLLVKNAYDFYSYIKLRILFAGEKAPINLLPKPTHWQPDETKITTPLDAIDFAKPENLLLSEAIMYMNKAKQLCDEFSYDEALLYCEKAVEIREKILGKTHRDTANVYNALADIYYFINKHTEAMDLYTKSLHINEKILGKNHPFIAENYRNIASVHKEQGKNATALTLYQDALKIINDISGERNSEYIYTCVAIANTLIFQRNYEKAYTWLSKILPLSESILGTNHQLTAVIYTNIAHVYKNQNKYNEALTFYYKALYINENNFDPEHPGVARHYMYIASVYRLQGHYEKALEQLDKASKIYDHHNIYTANRAYLNNAIALVHDDQGDYATAIDWYNKSLEINEAIHGIHHPETAMSYYNIGGSYFKQELYDKSIEFFMKALPIFEDVYGDKHNLTINLYKALTIAYTHLGDEEKAAEYRNKVKTAEDITSNT
ncbi:MAG: tetratricopeptide repeat protein [Defluviitaleaceae bacterium]|nr:tetratricopeptide repeat protein [Defluviitaleaceae bacterium]MCL2240562.1 tetratricopeptide repeat protein [Defluviitaleaceae bacterium]